MRLLWLGWIGLLAMTVSVQAQEQKKIPILLEGEIGVERFGNSDVRVVFPAGANIRLGAAFVLANEERLRIRPQAGLKLFYNEIEEGLTEQLLIIKTGGQVSYDLFYVGQTTFFPYLSTEYNWVSNFDAESVGEDVSYSDAYLRGRGLSQEVGLRIQIREIYLKIGYEIFNPRLRVRRSIIDEDLDAGYLTPASYPFRFNTVNVSIGFSLLP